MWLLLLTWLFVSAQPLYTNLQCTGEGGRRKKRNVLAIYSRKNLTAELLLIQSSQHALAAVRSPHQIDHKHLDAHK